MATIAPVISGTTIAAAPQNALIEEVNDSVKVTGNQVRTGALNNQGPLQRHGQEVITDGRTASGAQGSVVSAVIVCTLTQYNSQTRYNDVIYFIRRN